MKAEITLDQYGIIRVSLLDSIRASIKAIRTFGRDKDYLDAKQTARKDLTRKIAAYRAIGNASF